MVVACGGIWWRLCVLYDQMVTEQRIAHSRTRVNDARWRARNAGARNKPPQRIDAHNTAHRNVISSATRCYAPNTIISNSRINTFSLYRTRARARHQTRIISSTLNALLARIARGASRHNITSRRYSFTVPAVARARASAYILM